MHHCTSDTEVLMALVGPLLPDNNDIQFRVKAVNKGGHILGEVDNMPTVTILSLWQSSVTAQVVQPHGPPTGSELSRSQFASILAAIKDSINDPISKRISKGHKRRQRQSASDMKSLTTRVKDRFSATMCSDAFSLRYVGA